MFKKDDFLVTEEKEIFIGIKDFAEFNECKYCKDKLKFELIKNKKRNSDKFLYGVYRCSTCGKQYDVMISNNKNKWAITGSTKKYNKKNQVLKQGLYFKTTDDLMEEFMRINEKIEEFNKTMKPLEEFNG